MLPNNDHEPEDFRTETTFERYMRYISDALDYDEEWLAKARGFLIVLGEDPDALEREAAEVDGALRDKQYGMVGDRDSKESQSTHDAMDESESDSDAGPPPAIKPSLSIPLRMDFIGQQISEWFRSPESELTFGTSPDSVQYLAASQLRDMVLQRNLSAFQIGILSTVIGPLTSLFVTHPAPSEIFFSICAKGSPNTDGSHVEYTLSDATTLLQSWEQESFYSGQTPATWEDIRVNPHGGISYVAVSGLAYWLKDFWAQKHPHAKSDLERFVMDATLVIAAMAESKKAMKKVAEVRGKVGLTVSEKWRQFSMAKLTNDFYEEYTWEQFFGKEEED